MKGRFFVTLDPDDAALAYLDAAGARHVRALRLVRGDAVCAIVAPGREREAVIASLERDRVTLALGAEHPAATRDLRHPRVLAIALGDLARMDLVIEKATELGATAIQPFVAERSQARTLPPSRLERWRRIARTACEQCGRTVEPAVRPCVTFAELLAAGDGAQSIWLLSPAPSGAETGAAALPAAHQDGVELLLIVGPEGGLTEDENARWVARGALPITLGRRVLRFETAAIAALAAALVCVPDRP